MGTIIFSGIVNKSSHKALLLMPSLLFAYTVITEFIILLNPFNYTRCILIRVTNSIQRPAIRFPRDPILPLEAIETNSVEFSPGSYETNQECIEDIPESIRDVGRL
ncbi:hypothetical protein Droror1_Dr00011854 [Drosera rotundifolia]